jgi:integrase
VTANPARDLTPIEGANKARDRALSLAELRAYWKRIQAPEHAPLRFHLLTGCQRVQQLARATQHDFDSDTQSLRLLDNKGRRTSARQHHVPVLPSALEAMREMQGGTFGPYVFTLTGGGSGADYAGIFKRVHKIADAMREAGELPGGTFTPGDLRRTVETRLADSGVSRDVRARLQSHGLGGVQERHYDRADYLPQTRAALEILQRLLMVNSATIVPIRRKTTA